MHGPKGLTNLARASSNIVAKRLLCMSCMISLIINVVIIMGIYSHHQVIVSAHLGASHFIHWLTNPAMCIVCSRWEIKSCSHLKQIFCISRWHILHIRDIHLLV